MPLKKNQILAMEIESLSSDGSGVAHWEGETVFVAGGVPGDRMSVRIVKDCKRYAFGIQEALIFPSPERIAADCPVAQPCGGCCFRQMQYTAELAAKKTFAADAFTRIGHFSLPVRDTIPSPQVDRYRNKAQFPVGRDKNGAACAGFFAGRTHRIVPCRDCRLQPELFNEIAAFLCAAFDRYHITPYDEETGLGLVRHIFLRQGAHSGDVLVCLVCTVPQLSQQELLAAELIEAFPTVRTVLLNVNSDKTNVILGSRNVILAGSGWIEDTMCDVPIRLGPLSFYQVNTPAAENLYRIAAEKAALRSTDRLLDLYCGMGTIGLSMIGRCAELIGVEVIPEAIEAAKRSAAAMGGDVAQRCRFLCADAADAAQQLADDGVKPDVVVLDPPRKGCDQQTLDAVIRMAPRTIVMVSCNAATAARDCRILADAGYQPSEVQPVDLFPRTRHVEAVIALHRTATASF